MYTRTVSGKQEGRGELTQRIGGKAGLFGGRGSRELRLGSERDTHLSVSNARPRREQRTAPGDAYAGSAVRAFGRPRLRGFAVILCMLVIGAAHNPSAVAQQGGASGDAAVVSSAGALSFEEVQALREGGNFAAALQGFRVLADEGHAAAQDALGQMYNRGEGVPVDNAEATRWLRLAAEQGYASAQNSLGQQYSTGSGVPADATEALRWFRRAADQGYAIAQANVGVAYVTGRGAPQDDAEAVRWFRRAAEQGDTNGQYSLGLAYFRGAGAAKDDAEAARWFRRAAEQGDARAQFNLGAMYNNGAGVPEDYVEAYAWLDAAQAQDYPRAAGAKTSVARRMSDTQIEEAEALSREYRVQHVEPFSDSLNGIRVALEDASSSDSVGGGTPPRSSDGREVRATITESDGPTEGSLVTLAFAPGSAVPSVGTAGTLGVPTEVSALGGSVTMTVTLGAGECEVVSTDENVVVVRITKEGGKITRKSDGSVNYTLPGPGSEIVFEPR